MYAPNEGKHKTKYDTLKEEKDTSTTIVGYLNTLIDGTIRDIIGKHICRYMLADLDIDIDTDR